MGTWHGNNNDFIDENNDNSNDNNNNINNDNNGDRVTDLVLVRDALQVWVVHLMMIMITRMIMTMTTML